MKNNIYTYKRRNIDGYDSTDYTTFYYGGILELFKQYPSYFSIYTMDTDQKIEEISYDLYGSVDYCDVILAANNNVFLWSSPYNSDIILDQSNQLTDLVRKEMGYADNLTGEELIRIIDNIEENINIRNTNRRSITVPKPDKINTLLSLVTNYRKQNQLSLDEPER